MTTRINLQTRTKCPRCGGDELDPYRPAMNSLSRKDNRTYVCNACGLQEGLLNHLYGREADVWPNYPNPVY